jgi:nitrous oxidase accessory protein NosD
MPGPRNGWSVRGACGVLTCLVLAACGPSPTVAEGSLAPVPQGVQPPDSVEPSIPDAHETNPPLPAPPEGRSWYVSTQGRDDAAGTSEAPLRTLRRAVALVGPNEVIRVRSGVYAESFLFDDRGADSVITVRGEGSPLPTLVPEAGTRTAVVRVQGRWRLENLRVDVGGAPLPAVLFEKTSTNAILSGSELRSGTAGAGVLVEGARGVLLSGNLIHHFIREGADSHGVLILGPSKNVTVRGNEIHHNSGDSVQCQAGSAPAELVLVENNSFHDEGENGVDIKQCWDVTIRGNTMGGFPNTAIRAPGSSAGEAVVIHETARAVRVEGNTLSRAGRGISILADKSEPPEDIWVEDNQVRDIRDSPSGNGQGIRVAGARNVKVVGNTVENCASYALMLAADGVAISGLDVRDNTVRSGPSALLLRLGEARYHPGLVLQGNHYTTGGVLKADNITATLTGASSRYLEDFPGDRLTLASDDKLRVWRTVLGVDAGSTLLP